jgi:hypothetical protein
MPVIVPPKHHRVAALSQQQTGGWKIALNLPRRVPEPRDRAELCLETLQIPCCRASGPEHRAALCRTRSIPAIIGDSAAKRPRRVRFAE